MMFGRKVHCEGTGSKAILKPKGFRVHGKPELLNLLSEYHIKLLFALLNLYKVYIYIHLTNTIS